MGIGAEAKLYALVPLGLAILLSVIALLVSFFNQKLGRICAVFSYALWACLVLLMVLMSLMPLEAK